MADTDDITNNQIKQYVSNVDRDVYTVSNIPEEVVAVIFAYVSRSPKSFRDNIGVVIDEEQLGQERASKFHEKWVLNYGHASVAEHAAVHVGIERVSRLFSSVLELSNEYLSFTEYSQRYQKPVKGDFYTPFELEDKPHLQNEFRQLSDEQYDIYSRLNDILFVHLKETVPVPEGKDQKVHHRALEKIAFEDARYALNLSTYTNLGMTANARAIEDSLSELLSSRYSEVRSRAEEIKQEVRFSVPTLVKYANEKKYITKTRESLDKISSPLNSNSLLKEITDSEVNLLSWSGDTTDNPEEFALKQIIKAVLYEHSDQSYEEVSKLTDTSTIDELLTIFKKTVEHLGKFDNPVQVYKLINYKAEFVISEACWHQLLRHRKVNWTYKEPSVYNGVTIPPNIKSAGATELLREATCKSEILFEKLVKEGLNTVAPYVVTNAHNRRLIGKFDLWELFHLVNLRMSEGAQWDIKNVTSNLVKEIQKYHPNLVKSALARLGS
ncbi:MAG: FAD-dependent thymidylate synthase [Thermodesulfobacteriota bacterium]